MGHFFGSPCTSDHDGAMGYFHQDADISWLSFMGINSEEMSREEATVEKIFDVIELGCM